MIGLDTNVVVRYVVQDDPRQAAAATRLMERALSEDNRGFITVVTICEIAWVLAECYAADRVRIAAVVEALLETRQIVVESADSVWKALRAWRWIRRRLQRRARWRDRSSERRCTCGHVRQGGREVAGLRASRVASASRSGGSAIREA